MAEKKAVPEPFTFYNMNDCLKKYAVLLFMLAMCCMPAYMVYAQQEVPGKKEWLLYDLLSAKAYPLRLTGNPLPVHDSQGKAVSFNGISDGIFYDSISLYGLKSFTLEAIIRPDSGGSFEQRFFHTGEIRGDRILLELRSLGEGWYLDAFLKSGEQKIAMIDSSKLHPFHKWHHVALVVNGDTATSYVNGIKQCSSAISFQPLYSGNTSLGMRQDRRSWFKGAMYKISIMPRPLKPGCFEKKQYMPHAQ